MFGALLVSVAAQTGSVAVTKQDDAAVKTVAALRNCALLEMPLLLVILILDVDHAPVVEKMFKRTKVFRVACIILLY